MSIDRVMSFLAGTTVFFMGVTLLMHKRFDFKKLLSHQNSKWFQKIRVWSGIAWLIFMALTILVAYFGSS